MAGDSARSIIQYDGQTGAEISRFSVTGANNIRGMTIDGSTLYYAEIFQDTVQTYDLSQNPFSGGTLFTSSTDVDEPLHLEIGHNGNLFVTNRENTLIQEFDPVSGQFLGTFANIADFESLDIRNSMVEYIAAIESYFVTTAHDKIYQLDRNGDLVRILQSDLLDGALGLAFYPVPEPSTTILMLTGIFSSIAVARQRSRASAQK